MQTEIPIPLDPVKEYRKLYPGKEKYTDKDPKSFHRGVIHDQNGLEIHEGIKPIDVPFSDAPRNIGDLVRKSILENQMATEYSKWLNSSDPEGEEDFDDFIDDEFRSAYVEEKPGDFDKFRDDVKENTKKWVEAQKAKLNPPEEKSTVPEEPAQKAEKPEKPQVKA